MNQTLYLLGIAILISVSGCSRSDSIPEECKTARIYGANLLRNGHGYSDPPIQALIDQGSFTLSKVEVEKMNDGKPMCIAYINVDGIYQGNSYKKSVTVAAFPN